MPKKWWSVHARTKEAQLYGIDTPEGRIDFKGKGMFNTSDERIVRALEANKKDAYTVHDEQLSRAYDSGQWDVLDTKRGPVVKTTHRYQFGPSASFSSAWEEFEKRRTDKLAEPLRLSLDETPKLKKFLVEKKLANLFWYWDAINPEGRREKGVRVLGLEFIRKAGDA